MTTSALLSAPSALPVAPSSRHQPSAPAGPSQGHDQFHHRHGHPQGHPQAQPGQQPAHLVETARDSSSPLSSPSDDRYDRAISWITNYAPRSIQGQNGSAACFLVALKLIHRFGLDADEALTALDSYNRSGKCSPRWSLTELQHKIEDALQAEPRRSARARSFPISSPERAAGSPSIRRVSRVSPALLQAKERLIREAQQAAPAIFETFRFSPDDWLKASPMPIPERPETHGPFFLRGLPPGECVWIAENEWCSGQPDHNLHFGTVERWLRDRPNPEDWANHAQFISPSHFHSGAYSRCLDNVLYRRFLVLEADKLSPDWQENKCLTSAIVRWALQAYSRFDLKLFAVLDSAKKSAHHWLTWPRCGPLEWAELKITLVALGIDPQIFDLCRVVRMPGYFRSWAPEQPARAGGSSPSPACCGWTRLLYLDPQVLQPFDSMRSSRSTHPDHQPAFQATLGPGRSSARCYGMLTTQA
jgi:hypothetical protein